MSDSSVETKLESVFSKIFHGLETDKIHTLTRLNAERWDSLAHLNLIISIEEEFNISITGEEADEITSFESAALVIKDKQ